MDSLTFNTYKSTIENSPNYILICECNKVIYANRNVLKFLTGSYDSNIEGRDITDFIAEEYKDTICKHLNDDICSFETKCYREKFVTAEGKTIDDMVSIIPIKDTKVKTIIFANDSFNKCNNDSKSKQDYYTNVIHELKNPLNVILSAVQLINMYINNNAIQDNSSQLSKYINVIEQNGSRLLKNVNDLINIKKIEEGYLTLNLCNCDIVSLINNIVISQKDEAEYLGIKLNFKSNFKKKIMTCDIDKMESIFFNLISNALKFTNEGGKVEISLREKNNKLIFSVKDTGIGIEASAIDTIFDKYKQSSDSMINPMGSGVGLYIVKLLVKAQGGNINLISEPNKGSDFIIEFPKILYKDKKQVNFIEVEDKMKQADLSHTNIINI